MFSVANPKKVTLKFDKNNPKSKSRTQQQFRKDADINTIMAKYLKTGKVDHLNPRQPVYADFTNLGDFHQNMTLVAQAKQRFAELPSRIRERFQNDPGRLIKFLDNPANRKEAEELGLVKPTNPPVIDHTKKDPQSPSAGPAVPGANTAPAENTGGTASAGA